jgi:RNA polymerase sigma factor (sigma-70 family)
MTDSPMLRALSAAVGAPEAAPDGELLQRFAEGTDRTAFELVVRRHAEMVWGVCRAALGRDRHAAEDAFQATFLILARRAGTIRDASAAGWLFRVARNVAVRARARATRQAAAPLPDACSTGSAPVDDGLARGEIAPVIAEEVSRLAERFREPVVLCFYEGHTHAEAAARLGWPIGTVASRLARAKDVLRDRLTRRGVVLPAAGLTALIAPSSGTGAPALLIHSAVAVSVGSTGNVPPVVLSLTEGVLTAMRIAKLKLLAALSAVILVAIGITSALAASSTSAPPPAGPLRLTLGHGPVPAQTTADDKKDADAIAKELKALEGKWRIVKVEADGKELPADAIASARWTIKGDRIEVTDEFTDEATVLKLAISLDANPKHFDTTMIIVGKQKAIENEGAGLKDKLVPGLYKRDGDTLSVCMRSADKLDDGRPKELKAGEGVNFVVLERVKGEQEEQQALAGEWKVTKLIAAGKDDPAGQVGKTRWIFEDAKVTWLEPNAISPIMGLKLDPAAIPPAINFLTTDGKEVKWKGIYFRQNDKLTVCLRWPKSENKTSPSELKTGDDVTFMVLERVAKPGEPVVRP